MPRTMLVNGTIHRSRVQFHGHEMRKKRKDRNQTKTQKQATVVPVDRKHVSNDNNAVTEPPTRPVRSSKVLSFTKALVTSTEESAHSGTFKSELHAEVSKAHNGPNPNESAIFDDLYDSPSASLVLQAPVYKEVDGQLELQRPTRSETEESTRVTIDPSTSPSSFMKTLVTLFAGRRKSTSKSDKSKHHSRSHSVPTPVVQNPDHDNIELPPRAQSEYTPTPPLTPPTPPRLTHRQVIPPIVRRGAKNMSHVPNFKDVPAAPHHMTMGTTVTIEDAFTPAYVQRGFHVPSTTQAPADLGQRRNNSARNLLDREQDVWARWHAKYEKRETHPFAHPAGVPA